jgi:CRP/FNR family cyclic AMP-dependent transcriptional regulator
VTPDRLLLYAGYALIAGTLLAPRLPHVRMLVGGAAIFWLGVAFMHRDTGGMVASAALLALALLMIGRRLWENQSVRFNADEQAMVATLFDELPRARARHLLDQGDWLHGRDGDVLTREGEPVGHLYYLAEGEARVLSGGVEVGVCRRGDLIGELTVLSGETASATVVLRGPARFWCAQADDLRPYVEAHEDIRRAIEHGFATVLKAKLRASNRTIAEAAAHAT